MTYWLERWRHGFAGCAAHAQSLCGLQRQRRRRRQNWRASRCLIELVRARARAWQSSKPRFIYRARCRGRRQRRRRAVLTLSRSWCQDGGGFAAGRQGAVGDGGRGREGGQGGRVLAVADRVRGRRLRRQVARPVRVADQTPPPPRPHGNPHMRWRWRNFVPCLCQLNFAAIL